MQGNSKRSRKHLFNDLRLQKIILIDQDIIESLGYFELW